MQHSEKYLLEFIFHYSMFFLSNIHYHVDYGHCENWKKWWNFDLMVGLEVKWFGCSVWEIWCIQQFMNSFFSSDIHWLTHWCSHEAVKISALQLNTHATEKYSLDKAPGTNSLSTKAEVQLHHNENVFFFHGENKQILPEIDMRQ